MYLRSPVLAGLLLAMVAMMMARTADAATSCVNLPPSTLRLYDIKVPVLEEKRVPAAALDRVALNDALGSRHTMMLTTEDVVSIFRITHRIIPQPDGSVCDAPSEVNIGLGSGRRTVYLARDVADDPCVHRQMIAHADAHAQSFNAAVDRFIDDHRDILARGMTTLKESPAKTPGVARERWEAGIRAIVGEMRRQLLEELRRARATTDDAPSLAALADACGGKIRQMEKTGGI